jgi:bifunctional non-homologous end joining protein LigD
MIDIDHSTATKPEISDRPFDKKGWVFELKYDGFRMLAGRTGEGGGGVRLVYRSGKDATRIFPELVRALSGLPFSSLVIDGEVVSLDAAGHPSFHKLQQRARRTREIDLQRAAVESPVTLFAFDLLALEGFDLRPLPLTQRKALLRRVLAAGPEGGPLRYVDDVAERGEDLYRAVAELGLEGVVAKRADSPYRGGYTRDWLKIRVDRVGDFAVVAFAPGAVGFYKLYLAVYDEAARGFVYAGSVGTGFSGNEMAEIRSRLESLRRATPALAGPGPQRRGLAWVEPELVCEVRYKEWNPGGHLRIPVFLRLRDDKAPEECLRPVVVEVEVEDLKDLKDSKDDNESEDGDKPAERVSAEVRFSRLDKVFWPDEGYTKGDLIEYYRAVSPWILPYLKDRPLVVDRYPDGIAGKSFFQKSAPESLAGRIRSVPIRSEGSGRQIDYFLCDDEAALLEIANLGAIPLHIWSSRWPALDHPDWCILDLDPKTAPFENVVRIALEIRDLCAEIGLEPFVKTSGGSGLHVLLPLGGQLDHDQTRQLGELIARVIVDRLPAIATTARSIPARRGRVYVDALQNGRGKLLAAPFSVRPRPGATVSTPLRWPEVDGGLDVRKHTIRTVLKRLRRHRQDPLLPVLTVQPDLPAVLGRLLERV